MANLVHNLGFDLPYYGPETPVLSRRDLRNPDNITGERFVREVVLVAIGYSSLEQALVTAKQEFEAVAEATDTTVIDFNYGLYEPPELATAELYQRSKFRTDGAFELPEGLTLIADVATIHDFRLLKLSDYPKIMKIRRGTRQYERQRRAARQPRVTDMNVDQVGIGMSLGRHDAFIFDIEPRTRKPK